MIDCFLNIMRQSNIEVIINCHKGLIMKVFHLPDVLVVVDVLMSKSSWHEPYEHDSSEKINLFKQKYTFI